MSIKFSIFFLVTLVILQGTLGTNVPKQPRSQDVVARNMMDKVKEALKKLENKVLQLVREAIGKLAGLDITPEINKFITRLNEIISKAINTINDLQSHANQLGVDVSYCVSGSIDDIKNLGIEVTKELTSCASDRVAAANQIIQATMDQVYKSLDQVKEIATEFANCPSGIAAISCYTKISSKIAAAIVEFPLQIAQQYNEAVKLITTLKDDLTNCAMDKVSTAIPKIENIVKTVSTCVTDKINSHNF